MTIAAAFTTDEGLLFCADTQHTWPSTMKLQSTKLYGKEYASGARSLFAICGDVHHCKMLVQDCEQALGGAPSAQLSAAGVRGIVKHAFAETFRDHVFPDPTPHHVELLMGIFCPKDRASLLLHNTSASINRLPGYQLVGGGMDLAHYLVREKYQAMRGQRGNTEPLFRLAVETLKTIKDHVDGCGMATEVAWLGNDGVMSGVVRIPKDSPSEWRKAWASLR